MGTRTQTRGYPSARTQGMMMGTSQGDMEQQTGNDRMYEQFVDDDGVVHVTTRGDEAAAILRATQLPATARTKHIWLDKDGCVENIQNLCLLCGVEGWMEHEDCAMVRHKRRHS